MSKLKETKDLIGQKFVLLTEKVLCKDGWKNACSVNVGDELYGIDGLLHKVKEIKYEHDDIYELSFKYGQSIKIGSNSIIRVSTKKQDENMRKYKDERYKILPLLSLLPDYKYIGNYKYETIKGKQRTIRQFLEVAEKSQEK